MKEKEEKKNNLNNPSVKIITIKDHLSKAQILFDCKSEK